MPSKKKRSSSVSSEDERRRDKKSSKSPSRRFHLEQENEEVERRQTKKKDYRYDDDRWDEDDRQKERKRRDRSRDELRDELQDDKRQQRQDTKAKKGKQKYYDEDDDHRQQLDDKKTTTGRNKDERRERRDHDDEYDDTRRQGTSKSARQAVARDDRDRRRYDDEDELRRGRDEAAGKPKSSKKEKQRGMQDDREDDVAKTAERRKHRGRNEEDEEEQQYDDVQRTADKKKKKKNDRSRSRDDRLSDEDDGKRSGGGNRRDADEEDERRERKSRRDSFVDETDRNPTATKKKKDKRANDRSSETHDQDHRRKGDGRSRERQDDALRGGYVNGAFQGDSARNGQRPDLHRRTSFEEVDLADNNDDGRLQASELNQTNRHRTVDSFAAAEIQRIDEYASQESGLLRGATYVAATISTLDALFGVIVGAYLAITASDTNGVTDYKPYMLYSYIAMHSLALLSSVLLFVANKKGQVDLMIFWIAQQAAGAIIVIVGTALYLIVDVSKIGWQKAVLGEQLLLFLYLSSLFLGLVLTKVVTVYIVLCRYWNLTWRPKLFTPGDINLRPLSSDNGPGSHGRPLVHNRQSPSPAPNHIPPSHPASDDHDSHDDSVSTSDFQFDTGYRNTQQQPHDSHTSASRPTTGSKRDASAARGPASNGRAMSSDGHARADSFVVSSPPPPLLDEGDFPDGSISRRINNNNTGGTGDEDDVSSVAESQMSQVLRPAPPVVAQIIPRPLSGLGVLGRGNPSGGGSAKPTSPPRHSLAKNGNGATYAPESLYENTASRTGYSNGPPQQQQYTFSAASERASAAGSAYTGHADDYDRQQQQQQPRQYDSRYVSQWDALDARHLGSKGVDAPEPEPVHHQGAKPKKYIPVGAVPAVGIPEQWQARLRAADDSAAYRQHREPEPDY